MTSPTTAIAALLAAALALAPACGADDGGDGDGDGEGDGDAGVSCGELPDPETPWLRQYQGALIQTLSASPRATVAERAAARDALVGELEALGLSGQIHDYGSGDNVFAVIEATEPPVGTLLVGAHYDTVPDSPGANDNATGVAMVLSVARYVTELPCRDHDVIAVLFDEEEIGLVGSAAFADELIADGVDLVAAHTFDQMGWDENDDRLIEVELPGPGMLAFYQQAAADAGLAIPMVSTTTAATDHSSFRSRGFDAVGLTEAFTSGDTTPHFHAPTDTAATVELDYLGSTTTLVHVALGRLVAGE